MDISKAIILFQKYRDGTLTSDEKLLLEKWYLDYTRSGRELPLPDDIESSLNEVWSRLSDQNPDKIKITSRSSHRSTRYLWAAASLVLLLAAGWVLFTPRQQALPGTTGTETEKVNDTFSPTRETGRHAYLTLSDGKKVNLEETSGLLAEEGTLQVTKIKNGELVYRNTDDAVGPGPHARSYHEVSTPMAGQYLIRLPDETVVWLNAGSRLRFPTIFDRDERSVELEGEAYFDVSKHVFKGEEVPFKVKTSRQIIEVLGTQFNVNSYIDENSIRTTLVEGSISVNFVDDKSNRKIFLKPGQQLNYKTGSTSAYDEPAILDIRQIDPRSATAWKNGYFRFDNTSLEELMRQICRWYDMDVEYLGKFGKHEFVGEIERSAPLVEVLSILEAGNLSFRIDGKKITVTSESERFSDHS